MNELVERTGACQFCGQIRLVEKQEKEWLQLQKKYNADEDIVANIEASKDCMCVAGREWREQQKVIEETERNIELMFREEFPEIADIFQEAKTPVWLNRIKKITVTTAEHRTATMQKTKGSIMLQLKEVKNTELLV